MRPVWRELLRVIVRAMLEGHGARVANDDGRRA